ncbi:MULTISPECIES: hypothetical protein [unclassified Frondihabitans]|uniref:hypothetical protein n=1 Tax=unclassified Frondihabitans TaxID=2626248 RepID=UPI000F514C1E|nr:MULTISPECIES: hypothetical protein [unclassified Frondihabitans]RPE77791.1 hypothetical protein EDF37_0451 [Frondihabitans sp. PhB153]RPF08070.1 hypothetical protein EDF39_0452 [Frondihabitans sp. PhB161]
MSIIAPPERFVTNVVELYRQAKDLVAASATARVDEGASGDSRNPELLRIIRMLDDLNRETDALRRIVARRASENGWTQREIAANVRAVHSTVGFWIRPRQEKVKES